MGVCIPLLSIYNPQYFDGTPGPSEACVCVCAIQTCCDIPLNSLSCRRTHSHTPTHTHTILVCTTTEPLLMLSASFIGNLFVQLYVWAAERSGGESVLMRLCAHRMHAPHNIVCIFAHSHFIKGYHKFGQRTILANCRRRPTPHPSSANRNMRTPYKATGLLAKCHHPPDVER